MGKDGAAFGAGPGGINTFRSCFFVSAIAVMALAVRLLEIDRTTLWFDEVMTAEAVARPALALIRDRLM